MSTSFMCRLVIVCVSVCDQKEQERVPRLEEEEEERMMSWSPPNWTSGWARSSVWRRWDIKLVT